MYPVENRYSAAPNLKMYMIQESDRSMQMWLYEYHYMFIVQGSAIICPPPVFRSAPDIKKIEKIQNFEMCVLLFFHNNFSLLL